MNYDYNKLAHICDELGVYSLIDIISNILDRIDNPNDEEDVLQSLDDELIYYVDQWKVLSEYCSPQNANWNQAIEYFIDDLLTIVGKVGK